MVLTVPASFDASARELTREAALAAGLPEDLVLLEEPQAAVYAWLADVGDRWRQKLKLGDKLLVCDVGGGTTDLTLVGVREDQGELVLERLAVGNHLLVGGDNMDLALAHHVAGRFAERGVKLDPWQSVALWHSCRTAKETLLAAGGPDEHPIAVLGRGSRLIGKTVSVEVDRASVAELLVDGFFPRVAASDRPVRRAASGFRELGLPFEADTAITRHLAAFLQSHGGGDQTPGRSRPTSSSTAACSRPTCSASGCWRCSAVGFPAAPPPRMLAGAPDLDHAVARGAAYYGWAKQRGGMRIRGGTARAYYVGHRDRRAGHSRRPAAACGRCAWCRSAWRKAPRPTCPSDEIGLVVGEPAHFRFFSSAVRKQDRPGDAAGLLERRRAGRDRLAGGHAPGRGSRSRKATCRSASNRG